MAETFRTTPEDTDKMPSGIPYIVGNEAAERFSYYGMSAILFAFMTKYITDSAGQPALMSKEDATAWVHTFKGQTTSSGARRDRRRRVLREVPDDHVTVDGLLCRAPGAGLPRCPYRDRPQGTAGHGLFLIALGSGGIKPCVSAHVGDQFGARNKHLLEKVFGWFYFSINFGRVLLSDLVSVVADCEGRCGESAIWSGMGLWNSGVLMAWPHFCSGSVVETMPISRQEVELRSMIFSKDGVRALSGLVPLFLFISIFFALYDQTSSRWIEQAERMDRVFSVPLFGTFTADASQLQSVNAIFVMTMIPLFTIFVYPLLGKSATPLRKIGTGLFLIAGSFAMTAVFEQWLEAGHKVHAGGRLPGTSC